METKFSIWDEVLFFLSDYNQIQQGVIIGMSVNSGTSEAYTIDTKHSHFNDVPSESIETDLAVLKVRVKDYYLGLIATLEGNMEQTDQFEFEGTE